MNRETLIEIIKANSVAFQMSGSRYICNPPPLDTDEDYIALCRDDALHGALLMEGFSQNTDPTLYQAMPDFLAFRKGEFNVITTQDVNFFNRFAAATELAKTRNILEKIDRIKLFQSILYEASA